MFSLLERFYDAVDGDISVQNQSIYTLRRESLRGLIAYVEQSSPILGGTLRGNLLVGIGHATDEQCIDVLSRGLLHG